MSTEAEISTEVCALEPLTFVKVYDTNFSIMQNGSGELFIRRGKSTIRLTPAYSPDGFEISDFTSQGGKLKASNFSVR